MALNIGDLNLSVTADTSGLRRVTTELGRFQGAVNRTARAQSRSARTGVAAMARQQSAIKRASIQVKALRQQLRASGASAAQVDRVTNTFRRFTSIMKSGRLTANGFRRTMDGFNVTLARSRRELSRLKMKQRATQMRGFGNAISNMQSASVIAIGPLSRMGAIIEGFGAISRRSGFAVAGFAAGLVGMTVASGLMIKSAITSGVEMERLEARVRVATGTLRAAREVIADVSMVAKDLGLDVRTSIKGFSSLAAASRGTSLEGQGVKNVFEGIATASAALRLEAPQVEGAIRAIEQMMSKGNVQAEELRGQLGERLPGAFRLAAAAMNVTTIELNKMLKDGEVIAEDFLPKFSKVLKQVFAADAKRFAESLTGSVNGLKTAFFEFGVNLDRTAKLSSTLSAFIRSLAGVIQSAADNTVFLVQSIGGLSGALIGLGLGIVLTSARTLAFAGAIGTATRALYAFTAALFANPMTAFAGVTAKAAITLGRLALAAGGAVVGFKLLNRTTEDSIDTIDDLEESFKQLAQTQKEVGAVSAQAQQALLQGLQAEADIVAQQIRRDSDRLRVAQQRLRDFRQRPSGDPNTGAARMFQLEQRRAQTAEKLTENLQEQTDALRRINDMRARTEAFKPLEFEDFDPGSGADGKGKESEVDKFVDRIISAQQEVKELQMILADDTARKSLEELNRALKVEDLRADLAELSGAELAELGARLGIAADSAKGMANALAELFLEQDKVNESVKELQEALEGQPDVLTDINEELARLRGETAAMAAGPDAFEQFETLGEKTQLLEEFRQKMAEVNIVGMQQEKIIQALSGAFDAHAIASQQLEETEARIERMEKATRELLGGVGDQIVKMLRIGSQETISFGDVMVGVINDITEALLRMAVLEPFIQNVVDMVSGGLQRSGGGGGGDFFSQAVGFIGSALGGGIAQSARGNIFTSPSLTTIGERGSEAVLPLTRGAGGMLGVRAEGGGGGNGVVIVNVINQGGERLEPQGQQTRRGPNGEQVVDVTVKSAIQRLDARGELDPVFNRHGARRQGQFG